MDTLSIGELTLGKLISTVTFQLDNKAQASQAWPNS